MQQTNNEARRESSGLFLTTQQLFKEALDLIFPPQCASCGRVDYVWCPRCETDLINVPITPQGRYIEGIPVASTGVHIGVLQDAVQALKYENLVDLRYPLADRLIWLLHKLHWDVELVVPVPLHKKRYKQRGYNQSQLLAELLAKEFNLQCTPNAIARYRDTPSQVGLSQQERLQNMQDAFVADETLVSGCSVLLIDDVCTTGATLVNCTQALQQAGAYQVFGLTVTGSSKVAVEFESIQHKGAIS